MPDVHNFQPEWQRNNNQQPTRAGQCYTFLAVHGLSVETTVGPPATTSHVECTAAARARMGIPEGLVRYSTGIEDINNLIVDLEQALARIH